MDFVDEQDRALFGVGEIGQQVLRRGEHGAAGDLQRDAQVARDAGGEGRLAQAGRAVEQDVAQRLLAFAGRVDGDRQPLGDLAAGRPSRCMCRGRRAISSSRSLASASRDGGRRRGGRVRSGFAEAVAGEDPFTGHA